MNTFLNALKLKADTIQANIKKEPVQADVAPYVADMVTPADVDARLDRPTIIKVDRIINKNRIDVYFDVIPTPEQRELLKTYSFKFNPESKAWYNKDTTLACAMLRDRFNVRNLTDKEENIVIPSQAIQEPEKIEPSIELSALTDEPEAYSNYKKQVRELLSVLKCDSADLALIAIDNLYKKTFN